MRRIVAVFCATGGHPGGIGLLRVRPYIRRSAALGNTQSLEQPVATQRAPWSRLCRATGVVPLWGKTQSGAGGKRNLMAQILYVTNILIDFGALAQLQAEIGGALTRGATVLAGLGVELGLVADGAAGALEQQVRAFTAGKFGLGAEVTCHVGFLELSATTGIAKMPLREPFPAWDGGGLSKKCHRRDCGGAEKSF